MNKLHWLTASSVFLFCLVSASSASAALITYHYSGSWENTNGVDPQELDGALFDLIFTIDNGTLPDSSSATTASYLGDLTVTVTGSPGDVDGTYVRSDHPLTVRTNFNNFGAITFGNVNSTPSSPVTNTGGFIFFPFPRITLGVISDTSLPVGDFTPDVVGIWSTGTLGGGSYVGDITNLSATVVPVPAAVWMLASGILLLAARLRTTRNG